MSYLDLAVPSNHEERVTHTCSHKSDSSKGMCLALVFRKIALQRRLSRFRKWLVPMSGSWDSEWGHETDMCEDFKPTCFPELNCLWENPFTLSWRKELSVSPSCLNEDYTGASLIGSVDKPSMGLEGTWAGPHIKGATSPAERSGWETVFGFRYWIKNSGKLNLLTELSIV